MKIKTMNIESLAQNMDVSKSPGLLAQLSSWLSTPVIMARYGLRFEVSDGHVYAKEETAVE